MFKINKKIIKNTKELKFKMIKSSGSGGQNINKNSTAIKLEFDVLNSNLITDKIKNKILCSSYKYLTKKGKVIIKAYKHKSQKRNKAEAIDRLVNYLNCFLINKKKRIPTSPTKSSIIKRLKKKKENSLKKILRNNPINEKY